MFEERCRHACLACVANEHCGHSTNCDHCTCGQQGQKS